MPADEVKVEQEVVVVVLFTFVPIDQYDYDSQCLNIHLKATPPCCCYCCCVFVVAEPVVVGVSVFKLLNCLLTLTLTLTVQETQGQETISNPFFKQWTTIELISTTYTIFLF